MRPARFAAARPHPRSRRPTPSPVARSRPTAGDQLRGTPSTPCQASSMRASRRTGNSSASRARSSATVRGVERTLAVRGRAEAVRVRRARRSRRGRRRCAAGRSSGGARRRASRRPPSRSLPGAGGQRLRDDHRAVHRQQAAAVAVQARGVALGRADDVPGPHDARRGVRRAGGDVGHARVSRRWSRPRARPPRPARARACAGCTRAQCGVKAAPSTPSTATRRAVSGRRAARVAPSGGSPILLDARAAVELARVRATFSEPPLTMSHSMPSRSTAAPTSSTAP